MKKILSYATALIAGLCVFTSCADDRDSNPTLTQPTTFVLNNPAVGTGVVDLAKSEGIELSWSQPTEYTTGNAPVVATYTVEVSSTGTFNKQFLDENEDNTGADFYAFDETATNCKKTVPAIDLAKVLQKLNEYPEGTDIADQAVYFRVKSAVLDATAKEYFPIYSNVVSATVLPYYVELKDAPIIMWYLVGNMFGGKWGSVVGETALPMFISPDFTYDKKTGAGEIVYTNYFCTGDYDNGVESSTAGFKIQPASFNWDLGMTGNFGTKGEIIYRAKGDDGGHIVAPADGVYTIIMNTADNSAKMVPYEGNGVVNYGSICLAGDFNGWSDTPMLPYNKDGVENHAWYYVFEVTPDMLASSGKATAEFKFKIAGSWDTNWGFGGQDGAVNFRGVCGGGQSNLGLPVGKYCISFCDITGAFSIVEI